MGSGPARAIMGAEEVVAPPPLPPVTHPRMYLFSGHDSSVLPLLTALGLSVETWCVA